MDHLISDDHSWVIKYLWFVSKTRFWIFRNSLKYALSVVITFFINMVKSILFKNRSFLHLPYRHRIDWTCQCGKYSSGFTHFNAFMMGFIGFWFLSELMQEAQMFYGRYYKMPQKACERYIFHVMAYAFVF